MTDWIDLDALAARIPDRALVAIPADYSGVAMAATYALIRRKAHGLRLVTVPTSGLQADLLIGAGAAAEIETAGVILGEHGLAPRFGAAAKSGRLVIRDATCPALHAGLQAAEKGVPFMPLRGLIGSDLIAARPEWHIIDNPFAANSLETGDDPIVLLPAIRPDFALFHARWADRHGNVWIGRRRELVTMAHAAVTSLVTAEARYDGDLLADETMAAGTLPSLYVGAVAEVARGAWPLALPGLYAADDAELARYAAAAKTEAGFLDYLAAGTRQHAA